ncbi:MAG TPA: TMEM175 family protein [Burkholderiaceae bacterium]|nr:TMEM175 family protein [Burkholderiaceae bacterium]
MGKGRLEAFSDGVIAVIITIMVLELKVPRGAQLDDLLELVPVFFSYVLSYLYVGIYWNNHHHMLHTIQRVTGGILWANLHFLFWLSLVPFTTGWMAENHFATWPTFAYGLVLLLSALSYSLLQACVIRTHGADSLLARAVGTDFKGKVSPLLYLAAIALGFLSTGLALAIYVVVALMWLIPDRRIEKVIGGAAD